jgi:membrane protein
MFGRIWRRGWRLLVATWNGWRRDDGGTLSAAIAYYGVFSLFPLCLILIAGVGIVARYSEFVQSEQQALIAYVAKDISPWLADELETVLSGIQRQASLGGSVGLLMLILAAIGIFMQLDNVFARIWRSPPPAGSGWLAGLREVLWSRLSAFLTLLVIGVMLAVVFVTDVVLVGLQSYLTNLPAGRFAWKAAQTLVTVGCDSTLLAAVYWVIPKAHVPWRAAFGGGLFAAVIWAVGRWLLLLLLVGKEYSAYGILGALMGVMLWYYFASVVIFLGAEFAHALSEDKNTV